MRSSISISMWRRNSASIDELGRRQKAGRRKRISVSLENPCDGTREEFPGRAFHVELFPALRGQPVEACLSSVWRDPPGGCDLPLCLEPIERRIERALVDLEDLI